EMKKKIVALGIMMALSVTAAAGCGQKAANETTAQAAAETSAADAADTTAAEAAGAETTAAAQSDGSYQYVSPADAVA
ncbi:hypothetical protein, partial [Eggerthella lenta]|uniref:hypothetical protein n=1 Tax=Eggerthella lenta TaxID=84112 RepID=UPI001D077F55